MYLKDVFFFFQVRPPSFCPPRLNISLANTTCPNQTLSPIVCSCFSRICHCSAGLSLPWELASLLFCCFVRFWGSVIGGFSATGARTSDAQADTSFPAILLVGGCPFWHSQGPLLSLFCRLSLRTLENTMRLTTTIPQHHISRTLAKFQLVSRPSSIHYLLFYIVLATTYHIVLQLFF